MPDNAANTGQNTLHGGAGSAVKDGAAGRDRRREKRLSCDPSSVFLELAGHLEPVEGQIVEVSHSGLHLRMGTSALIGESVRVTRTSMIISGQIRYCQLNEAGSFDTGVLILDVQYLH